jgi:hypothetical protein
MPQRDSVALRFVWLALLVGCGAAPVVPKAPSASPAIAETTQTAGHPPVAVLVREGDPSAAVAVAVLTVGIEPTRGAEVPVALAALVEARLATAGIADARVVPGAEEFRIQALAPAGTRGREVVAAIRASLLTPLAEGGPEMAAVQRKLLALSRRPIADPALDAAARCAGEPFANPPPKSDAEAPSTPTVSAVETWRAATAGLGRTVFAAVGPRDDVLGLAASVGEGPPWPAAAPVAAGIHDSPSEPLRVYDATPDLPSGAARLTLTLHTANAERAAAAAESLGQVTGALSARLGALEPAARIRDVTATAHVGGGCLVVTVDLPAPDATADPPATLAAAANVLREEMLIEVTDARVSSASARDLANRASDPREAAERAAFWTLVLGAAPPAASREPTEEASIAAGVSFGRGGGTADALTERSKAVHAELDRVVAARGVPIAEVRGRLERGQPELWVLLASPCGTETETEADAGAGAMAAVAIAERAREETRGSGIGVEGWAAPDGIGVLAHAASVPGETPEALARRVAGFAARSFGASSLEPSDVAHARGRLLANRTSAEDAHGFAVLANAIAPGRPSWIDPFGTTESLERSSDASIRARLDALRAGPLRIGVIANQDPTQVDVALRTVDQWIVRRAGTSRICPVPPNAPAARVGTYAVERPGASSADAWLAFAIPDSTSRQVASVVAAALDGPGGLLEKALSGGLARAWAARVTGLDRASALVVRVSSPQGSLDAAVAETRALFDRLRQGALTEVDRTRALASLADERRATQLDPKARLIALWRGEGPPPASPTLDAIHAFTALTLKDDALVLVATRPPRLASMKAP